MQFEPDEKLVEIFANFKKELMRYLKQSNNTDKKINMTLMEQIYFLMRQMYGEKMLYQLITIAHLTVAEDIVRDNEGDIGFFVGLTNIDSSENKKSDYIG